MKDWTKFSKKLTNLKPEMAYLVSDKPSQFQNKKLNITIKYPTIDRKIKEMITTKETLNKEQQLSEYYKFILKLKKEHKKTFNDIHCLFWLRLFIWDNSEYIYITFPWYDTVNEFKFFFRAFDDNKTGEIFFDIDQGWQLEIRSDNKFYYIRQTDPDDNGLIIQNIKTDKTYFKNALKKLENSIDIQIAKLTNLTGIDLWTDREYLKKR